MADETFGVLGDADVELFREMAAAHRLGRQRGMAALRPQYAAAPNPGEPPWSYLALTPPGGIPAMWEEVAGGGTGSGTRGDATPGTGTGTLGDAGDRPGFADCDVYQLLSNTTTGRYLTRPRVEPVNFKLTVYNASFQVIPGGHFVVVQRDPWGVWWADPNTAASAAATTGFWARLTGKTYVAGQSIRYTFEPVTDAKTPVAIAWTDGAVSGSFAYEVNDIDVPAALTETPGTGTGTTTTQDDHPTIVWVWPGHDGTYYLFDSQPRWEIIELISGGNVTYVCYLKAYDQTTGTLFNADVVIGIDANALP